MSLSQLKIALIGIAVVTAFVAGWKVNGWRHEAAEKARVDALTERLNQRLTEQTEAFLAREVALRERENALLQTLTDERTVAEALREDIRNKPVVTQIRTVEGECPVCAVVDSMQYRSLYNRAATGALPDPGTGDGTL